MFIQLLTTQLFQFLTKMEMLFHGHLLAQKDLKDQESPHLIYSFRAGDGAKAFEQGLRTLTVQVKGRFRKEASLRSLQSRGFKILSIKDTTPMPHNGARPPKEGSIMQSTSSITDKNWKALIKPNKLDITSSEDKTIAKAIAEPLEKVLDKQLVIH